MYRFFINTNIKFVRATNDTIESDANTDTKRECNATQHLSFRFFIFHTFISSCICELYLSFSIPYRNPSWVCIFHIFHNFHTSFVLCRKTYKYSWKLQSNAYRYRGPILTCFNTCLFKLAHIPNYCFRLVARND